MPLPEPRSGPWPPAEHSDRLGRMGESRAWYGGDPGKLATQYGGGTSRSSSVATTINPDGKGIIQRAVGYLSSKFWSQTVAQGESDTRRHLPIANDLAVLSSELLHSEPPTFTVLGPLYENDGEEVVTPAADGTEAVTRKWRKGDPMPETVKAQERLDYLLDQSRMDSLLLQASELGAALGSSPLRIAFDKTKMTEPRIVRVNPAATVPMHSWGAQTGVVFWRVLKLDWIGATAVARHLELHEAGKIFHGLYVGTSDDIGDIHPMADGDAACKAIAPGLGEDGALSVSFSYEERPVRTAVSIPNVLPDPLDIDNLVGRSDYTMGVIDLMDSADRIYSQLMENVEDARGKVLIARSMLESAGIGKGLTFDTSQRYFTKLNVPPAEKEGGGLPLEKIQFELRAAEYLQLLDAIQAKAISSAGYSPDGDARPDGRDVTATEVNSDNRKSMSTRDKKIRYWADDLAALAHALLVIDAAEFNSGVKPYPVKVTYPEAVQPTLLELAGTAKMMKDAKVASLTTLVALVHPDWNDGQVDEEVAAIQNEGRIVDPAVIGLSGRLPGDPPPAPPTGAQPAVEPPPAPRGARAN